MIEMEIKRRLRKPQKLIAKMQLARLKGSSKAKSMNCNENAMTHHVSVGLVAG